MILHKATKANMRHLTDTNNKKLLDAFQWNTCFIQKKIERLKYQLVRHLNSSVCEFGFISSIGGDVKIYVQW